MCVLIAQREGANALTRTQLENGWSRNPDGGGFAYIDPDSGEIVVEKAMVKDEFIDDYIEAFDKYGEYSPFIVHMRIATSGGVSLETAHPFHVARTDGEMVVAHNGIIDLMTAYTGAGVSDTIAFAEWILDELPQGWLDNAAVSELVEEYIDYSKLAFLTTEPEAKEYLYILNEDLGEWQGNTWFSNKSCEKPKVVYPYKKYTPSTWKSDGHEYSHWWSEAMDDKPGAYVSTDDIEEWLEEGDEGTPDTMFVRGNVNSIILRNDPNTLGHNAKMMGYCPDCFYKPCQCETTCYFCNYDVGECSCENKITIGEMKYYTGDNGFGESRKYDLTLEAEYEGVEADAV